jgi:hypothetical protein
MSSRLHLPAGCVSPPRVLSFRRDSGAYRHFGHAQGAGGGRSQGLAETLLDFLLAQFYIADYVGRPTANLEVHRHFARTHDVHLPASMSETWGLLANDPELLLDAVDFVLGRTDYTYRNEDVILDLRRHLSEARSVYTVGQNAEGEWELQDRQPAELTDVVGKAASGGDRAATHLQDAWSKGFGRDPDHRAASRAAVDAIEAAAKPIVSPSNERATLGTMIRDMKAKPEKWITDSAADGDIVGVIGMMELVWTGHFRHGNEEEPIDPGSGGTEMILDVAAVLVHWFRSGRIRRV